MSDEAGFLVPFVFVTTRTRTFKMGFTDRMYNNFTKEFLEIHT